jgi:two-component system, NarL family, nitrate/nitrite response regulator NarL
MHVQKNNPARAEASSENLNEINDSEAEAVSSLEACLFTPSDPDQVSTIGQPLGWTGPLTKKSLCLSPCSTKSARLIPTVIVDKSALFRAGLRHVLGGGQFQVLADCSFLRDLPKRAFDRGDRLVLLGLDKDHSGGAVVSQISALKANEEGSHIVIFGDRFWPEQWLHTIKAGASGYLIKDEVTGEALLRSLELVLLGAVVIPQGLHRTNGHVQIAAHGAASIETVFGCSRPQSMAAQSPDRARLSGREQMILAQLIRGASNKHVARELNIAEGTVKVHVKSLFRKIGVDNRTRAAMWAIDHLSEIAALSGNRDPMTEILPSDCV